MVRTIRPGQGRPGHRAEVERRNEENPGQAGDQAAVIGAGGRARLEHIRTVHQICDRRARQVGKSHQRSRNQHRMSSNKNLNRLGAVEAARAIERNEIRCVDLAQACLDRIAERNPEVGAFVSYDADKPLGVARRLDTAPSGHALRGIPFAVKDVIDTTDYPTQYGSPIYKGFQPALDAACVVMAKSQGGVLLGKVATGEFATQTPSCARNPLRLTHTPGGSSSGSAAAVADCMVPAAFATQTTGSIVRPAIYCGVVGYKPSFGLIATAGLKALSPSQDTIGVIARKVEDAAFFTLGLHGAKTVNSVVAKPRIALCLSRQWDYVKPETLRALESLVRRLELAGCVMSRIWLPEDLE